MDILGIGPLELLVILILALAIFGPDKLPEIGAKLGRGMQQMRRTTREFSREIEKAREALDPDHEISGPLQEIGGAVKDAAALAQATRNPSQAIRDSVMRELKAEPAPATPAAPEPAIQAVPESPNMPKDDLDPGSAQELATHSPAAEADTPPTPAPEALAEAPQPPPES